MSVAATYAKLCSVVAASSGIVTCSTSLPMALNDAGLPWAVILPGAAEWNEHASGLKRQIRTYTIRVYVKPVAQGLGYDEGFTACLGPLNALGNTILGNVSLDNTVDEIRQPIPDTGIMVLAFNGIDYHGFEYRLQITEKGT